jgi:hypothetical protein
MTINWKKGFFERTINLTQDEKWIGSLRSSPWSNSAQGVLKDKKYIFKSKGVFNKVVLILEQGSGEEVGSIQFREFSSKAKIHFKPDENATLFVRNFWQTKWRLSSEESFRIDYQGGQTKGQIETIDSVPEALILAGLFATHRTWEYSTIVAIIVAMILASS